MAVALTFAAIFFAKIAHVSLGTLRIIYLTRGNSGYAAFIGFFEAIIYLSVLSMVLSNIDQWANVLVYGFGFGCGNFVGSKIEEKIAVGFVQVQVITTHNCDTLEHALREEGYGVTSMPCYGKEGAHVALSIWLKRRDMPAFLKTIKALDSNAFVSIYDARKIMGGYFTRMKSK